MSFQYGGVATTVRAIVPVFCSLADPDAVSYPVAVMVVVPAETAVTRPALSTVATAGFELSHEVIVTSFLPSSFAVSVCVRPTTISSLPSTMTSPSVWGRTVRLIRACWPPAVAVIVAVPAFRAVTRPVPSTVATVVLSDAHVTFAAPAGLMVAFSCDVVFACIVIVPSSATLLPVTLSEVTEQDGAVWLVPFDSWSNT